MSNEDAETLRRVNVLDECRQTPSRRTVKARKTHRCEVCHASIEPGKQYLAFTVRGPATWKVCAPCDDEHIRRWWAANVRWRQRMASQHGGCPQKKSKKYAETA